MQAAVLILYNEPVHAAAEHAESDAGVWHEVAHVAAALEALSVPCRAVSVRTLADVGQVLGAAAEPYVFNLVERLDGPPSEACLVPAVCAAFGKAYTGSGAPCQLLALDKWQTHCALSAAGVFVPRAAVIPPGPFDPGSLTLPPPRIVKPLCADASEGIDAESVLMTPDPAALRRRVRYIHAHFGQAALVEQYIEGRELNVALLERNGVLSVLPPAEIDFSAFPPGKPRIVGYRAKWIEHSFEYRNTPRRIPAPLDPATARRLRAAARAAWQHLGCRDYARVDLRLPPRGEPFVMDVNPNPDLSPEAGFAAALAARGIGFSTFVRALLENAGMSFPPAGRPAPRNPRGAAPRLRRSRDGDREAVLDLLKATGVFHAFEIEVAREVLDEALKAGPAGHYQSYTALRGREPIGWICFGAAPCTSGTFDLYWLAVHPRHRGLGVAAALLARAETDIRARAGRFIVVETSSRAVYRPARRFYRRHGFLRAAVLKGFYAPHDNKLVYVKPAGAAPPRTAPGYA
ncbi:MAG: GNAT family N-acetyltransferase [Lentisphaerae bacterium]|nr:GNAT family N-acetyltransferase [Lentisphaerota bacterium]